MDIELARKFFLEYLPKEAQPAIHEVFAKIRENPLFVLNNGLQASACHYLEGDQLKEKQALAHGLITGFTLAYCMRHDAVLSMMKNFLNEAAKARGENVIQFFQKKGV